MVNDVGRSIVIIGIALVIVGVAIVFADKIPFLGRLPGDIVVRRKNLVVYFPLVTMLIVSVVLTILLNFFSHK